MPSRAVALHYWRSAVVAGKGPECVPCGRAVKHMRLCGACGGHTFHSSPCPSTPSSTCPKAKLPCPKQYCSMQKGVPTTSAHPYVWHDVPCPTKCPLPPPKLPHAPCHPPCSLIGIAAVWVTFLTPDNGFKAWTTHCDWPSAMWLHPRCPLP